MPWLKSRLSGARRDRKREGESEASCSRVASVWFGGGWLVLRGKVDVKVLLPEVAPIRHPGTLLVLIEQEEKHAIVKRLMPLYGFDEVQAKPRFSLSRTSARRNDISVECLKMGLKLLPSLMQTILDGGEGYREAIGDLLHAHILIVKQEGHSLVFG